MEKVWQTMAFQGDAEHQPRVKQQHGASKAQALHAIYALGDH